ncbi:flavin reductase [Dissulfurirhabdus thermomarina]|uniref:Flavin reductase n=1 Tax=Dissulfurirhabdus thermomarina TaxID=1765737 RepID=A0A6N9TJL4_DISTH|nr:flavin reductase family protein [Dissulfurirhabdus thermomarina]NDY41278.1 flavin reductase [Dissulfurirhabdus thermomarina]NMX23735.1 flavin reductase [Dissulfurirhabdus thermomarina]
MQAKISAALPTGVYVVTVRHGDRINGMTAAWVTQVSFKPPMAGVAVAPARYTHDLIQEAGRFCLNALPEGAADLARHFGFKSGRKVDKFKAVAYSSALRGSPVLEAACAYVECEVDGSCTTGDHTFFYGTVIDAGVLKEGTRPLVFRWEDFFGGK